MTLSPNLFLAAAAATLLLVMPSVARADPCEGVLPRRAGHIFEGIVRYVGDGDSLCIGETREPNDWIEVRLADFDAPELQSNDGPRSKAMLAQVAGGRPVTCIATRGRSGRVVVFDRVIATCRIGDRSIGDLLRQTGAPEGGN